MFQRAELDCTQCHIAAGTRGVPGVLLRSVFPTQTGTLTPRSPSYITDQESPLKQRWGGWYVNGSWPKHRWPTPPVTARGRRRRASAGAGAAGAQPADRSRTIRPPIWPPAVTRWRCWC